MCSSGRDLCLRNKVYHCQKGVEFVNQAMMLDLPLARLAAESEIHLLLKMS
jgi:hypothetical protein